MSAVKIIDLLQYVKAECRICPESTAWHVLLEMPPDGYHVCSDWEPPLPLILAAGNNTSDLEKILRLKENIEYAAEKRILEQVDQLLRSLQSEEWHMLKR